MSAKSPELTTEQEEFRQYCRCWLQDNLPADPPVALPSKPILLESDEQMAYLKAWNKSAYDAGLIGCDYPKEFGGGGHTGFQKIANREMLSCPTPYIGNPLGWLAAPTLLYHGSQALKERFIQKILSGQEIWCQGFSEPGAGSDLASVQTFAERKGNKWIINGHKVWTTLAHLADWMILLARTDKSLRYDGLTYFVIPIRPNLGDGVTVRPLIKITGESGFNEVIIENLEIDDMYRVDDVGKGWQVAQTTLRYERDAGKLVKPKSGGAGVSKSKSKTSRTAALIELAKSTRKGGKLTASDPFVREQIMQLVIRETGLRQNVRRARVPSLLDHPTRLPLQTKLLATELDRDIARLALDMEGAAASLYVGDENVRENARWSMEYLNSFGYTIAGGTSEIQRNILGERVLNLPKTR